MNSTTGRTSEFDVHPLILNRWSPRAMSGELLSHEELMTLFEAARWAPSCFNDQPWKFHYATKDSPKWNDVFSLLVEFNQSWCKNAAALAILTTQKNFSHNGKPNRNAISDSGAAWENLALQASSMGLIARGMGGYDVEKARSFLNLPEDTEIIHMIAIGRPGKKEDLPTDLQTQETPSGRKELKEIAIAL